METGKNQKDIRNIAILGNVETGKVSFLNILMNLSEESCKIQPEEEKGMYIMKSNDFNYEKEKIHATYICSRGRLDFMDEISSILRVVDGAFVIVDALEGLSVLVQTALEKCIQQKIEPIIVLNKIDKLLEYVKYDQFALYSYVSEIVKQASEILNTSEGFTCDINDNFMFASLKYQIIFNKGTYINVLKEHETGDKDVYKNVWFDSVGEKKGKQWTIHNVVKPVCDIIKTYITKQKEQQNTLENVQQPKLRQSKSITNQWLSSNDVLKKAICNTLPSPLISQKYRAQTLYTGDIIDPCGQGILKCSTEAPLMIYVTNTINDPDNSSNVYRLARLYSGTLTKGDKVKIFDRKYKFGSKSNIFYAAIKEIMQPFNNSTNFLQKAIAGQVICITGVDHKIIRAATISTFDLAHPLAYIRSSQKRVAASIKCQKQHYPQMIQQLQQLSRRRQGLRYKIQQTGQAFVLGSSIESIAAYIEDLKRQLSFKIQPSNPFVKVKQTITKSSEDIVMIQTLNKQNKVFMKSDPLCTDLCQKIERKQIKFYGDKQARNEKLINDFSWSEQDAMRIWSFGPDQKGPNILVDATTSNIKSLYESKSAIISGFSFATAHGALVEEPLRGVRIDMTNFQFSDVKQNRKQSQITEAVRKAIYGCQLISSPALLQPIFICQIKIKGQQQKQIQEIIKLCRGRVIKMNDIGSKKIINAYIPGIQKKIFQDKFTTSLSLSMQYFQSIYHHDELIQNFSLQQGTPTHSLLLNLRKMKGLPQIIPNKKDFINTL